MKIKFLQTTLGAKDIIGNSTTEYQAGESYELPEELAKIFLNAKLAEKFKELKKQKQEDAQEEPEEKSEIKDGLENKAIKHK